MRRWLRKIRGALGIASAWAASWAVAETLIIGGLILATGNTLPAGTLGAIALSGAGVGFLSGLAFSAVFGAINRHLTLDDIRVGPTALLGATAGGIVPALISASTIAPGLAPGVFVLMNLAIGAVMGTATAVGIVWLARLDLTAIEGTPESALLPTPGDHTGTAGGLENSATIDGSEA